MNSVIPKHCECASAETETATRSVKPHVDIYETKDGYVLEADLPGVSKEGLAITVAGQELVIVGRPSLAAVAGEALFRERPGAHYRAVFELAPAIDASRISARINQGLLHLELPKSEAVKPRFITVSE